MSLPLRVLMIEDSEDDALLIARNLEKGGYDIRYRRVETPAELATACDVEDWDLVISDYSMPHFSGTAALDLVRSKNKDVPFIFVSGTIGEETAVAAMRNGAQDYLMKSNLKRLLPAVQRELHEYAERQDRKQLERHLQQLQKFEAIGRLSGGIAHDFNNMIGAIMGWAELGYEESEPNTKTRDRFRKIREQSNRAAKLTSQLLAFGRRQILQPRRVSLNILIQEEMNFLERVLEKNIEVQVVPDPNLLVTRADPTQLQQVLMNLCLNARDAMPEGGKLTIETSNILVGQEFQRKNVHATPGRYVALIVTDTGIGMDATTAERVFEPFFTTKEMGRGTGLGLATVYGIVKQHSGFIYLESKPGQGSSFSVYFPAEEGVHEPREVAPETRTYAGSGTILLAEDDNGLRESAQEMLQRLGYRVIAASDGGTALQLFSRNVREIDLVVLDVMMPYKGGVEVYRQMSETRADLGVIFTTGYATEPACLAPLLEGGALLLQKPYSLSELSQMVHSALDRKRTS